MPIGQMAGHQIEEIKRRNRQTALSGDENRFHAPNRLPDVETVAAIAADARFERMGGHACSLHHSSIRQRNAPIIPIHVQEISRLKQRYTDIDMKMISMACRFD